MPKLMKTHPIDEIAALMQALGSVDFQNWQAATGPIRKALEKHNDIMLALPMKGPLREELAEWLGVPLPEPEEYNPDEVDWESRDGDDAG
jgi:hypothetical protein